MQIAGIHHNMIMTTVKHQPLCGVIALTHTRYCSRRIPGVPGSAKRLFFNRGRENLMCSGNNCRPRGHTVHGPCGSSSSGGCRRRPGRGRGRRCSAAGGRALWRRPAALRRRGRHQSQPGGSSRKLSSRKLSGCGHLGACGINSVHHCSAEWPSLQLLQLQRKRQMTFNKSAQYSKCGVVVCRVAADARCHPCDSSVNVI